ncbi:MAG: hypothetical protein INR73_21665 [Williamsia sp.]|nr:hypothetical protein [Williamsia sp.]
MAGRAQTGNSWRARIDDLIEQTDSLSLKSQTTFYTVKYLKHDRTIKETWYYTMKDGKPVFFQLHYVVDSSEFTESYYLDRNRLVCMARFEDPYINQKGDYNNTEIFFFQDNTLRQYVTSGHRNAYTSKFERQNDCLIKFEERFTELRANLRQKGLY